MLIRTSKALRSEPQPSDQVAVNYQLKSALRNIHKRCRYILHKFDILINVIRLWMDVQTFQVICHFYGLLGKNQI